MRAARNREHGAPAREAERAARRRFGNLPHLREQSRDAWGWAGLESVLVDMKLGVRMLARNPLFSVVAIVVLALGIGANTAVFTVVHAVLIDPYPFPDSSRLMHVHARHVSGQNQGTGYAEFADWRAQAHAFAEMAIYPTTKSMTLSDDLGARVIPAGVATLNLAASSCSAT